YEQNAGGGGSSEPGGKGQALDQLAAEPDDESAGNGSDEAAGSGLHGQANTSPSSSGERARTAPSHSLGRDAYINGIDADTGEPLEPLPDAGILARHRDSILAGPRTERQLEWWVQHHGINDPERLPVHRVQPRGASHRLDEAGWAVLFGPDVSAQEKEALEPLLSLRRRQAGSLFVEETLPRPGVTSMQLRFRKKLGFGPADPEKLPYYLLLVGSPVDTPFELQYGLDVQYAVGRLHFDQAEDYARYAQTVVRQETSPGPVRRGAVFGVDTGKPVDRFLIEALVDPLTHALARWKGGRATRPAIFRAAGDRKADLEQILQTPPGFLFAAGHGLRVSNLESPTFHIRQGALLCSGHEGGPVPLEACFSGKDVENLPDLEGLIAFSFACYSAGVPSHDTFADDPLAPAARVAPRSMVSHLAKRMLAHGAQAFVGHVDRAWDTSFDWSSGEGDQVKVYESVLTQLLEGARIGHAFEWINQKYAEGSTALVNLHREGFLTREERELLARVTKATLGARNYVVIGDPAVRLPGFGGR
ncbi:MAG: C25 family cysteine peptidase, partial [Holophagales bacterium]|nr:C25 family cysteine peptidase [Holophagales bacterium]